MLDVSRHVGRGHWWAARISAWVFPSPANTEATLTLLGALTVTSSPCDSADDVRLGGAFLGPDHEFGSVPFIACGRGQLVPETGPLLLRLGRPLGPGGFASLLVRDRVLDQREQPEAVRLAHLSASLAAPFGGQTWEFGAEIRTGGVPKSA